ncbi:MAG TPA: P-II family nitrogen regulator [Firmicutes bacterium]|jgi:nitrogen regulatory protein P-II 1|nr:P-II family nitrogen regulator [Bacillota bacterium]
MKKIEAIIREEKLQEVRVALEEAGFIGMTVFDVKGRGAQGGISLQWRVGDYRIDLLPKKMIMLVVKDQDYPKVVDVICKVSKTGAAGDGKIFVSTIDEVIRVRTEESGEPAL